MNSASDSVDATLNTFYSVSIGPMLTPILDDARIIIVSGMTIREKQSVLSEKIRSLFQVCACGDINSQKYVSMFAEHFMAMASHEAVVEVELRARLVSFLEHLVSVTAWPERLYWALQTCNFGIAPLLPESVHSGYAAEYIQALREGRIAESEIGIFEMLRTSRIMPADLVDLVHLASARRLISERACSQVAIEVWDGLFRMAVACAILRACRSVSPSESIIRHLARRVLSDECSPSTLQVKIFAITRLLDIELPSTNQSISNVEEELQGTDVLYKTEALILEFFQALRRKNTNALPLLERMLGQMMAIELYIS